MNTCIKFPSQRSCFFKALLSILSTFCILTLCMGMLGCDSIFTPDEITPETTTPESTTPESTTPESTTPESTTPESTTPSETLPDETAPNFGEGYTVLEGRVVKTNNGYFILPNNSAPDFVIDYAFIELRTTFSQIDLSNLKTGDHIKISVETFMESYPVQTEIYQLAFVDNGNIDNIPESIIAELTDLSYTIE